MSAEPLEQLDDDLWVASRPLPLWVGDVGTRMTVIRLRGGGLLLHSPVSLDPAIREALDRIGVVVDFEHLKEAVGEVCRRFHYKDINAHPAFAGRSPSAEEVARYFFEEVRSGMGAEGKSLRRVRVWEAPGCSATYAG